MLEPVYESTDTIHLKISEVRNKARMGAQRVRDELGSELGEEESYNPLFLQLLESVYDAVILTQLHGKIVKANTRASEFFQHSTETLTEQNIIHLIAGGTFEHLHTIYENLSGEKRLFIEAECVRRNGSRFPADITVSLLQVEESEQLCFFIRNISARKKTEAALQQAQEELVSTAHRAGMAEIATGVLHDVGNLLNSVNISAELLTDAANTEAQEALMLLSSLLDEQEGKLARFFAEDERGPQIPEFIRQISETLADDLATLQKEATHLKQKIATINESITMQQEYAKTGLFMEEVELSTLIEDALALQKGSITRHDMMIDRRYSEVPPIRVQKSKLIHAIVNLISNAKDAMLHIPESKRVIIIETGVEDDRVYCRVTDNGEGIAAENLERVFTHGFSTKEKGHGFGLHTSANFMTEMGGSIVAQSEGIGHGATFVLFFPLTADDAEGVGE